MILPERERDSENALIARARSLFSETAERAGLQYEWDESAPVDLACRFPAQKGLDFDLWLSISDDEFVCSGAQWYANIFPVDDEHKWGLIVRVVQELVSGEARVALYKAVGWSRPYWTETQLRIDGRWTSVSTGAGCAIPPIVRPTYLRNGHSTTVGSLRPALGSAVGLLCLVVALYWLLK
jgi:hypothetical protein